MKRAWPCPAGGALRRARGNPGLVRNRLARAEGARLEQRHATALVRVAHGLVAYGGHLGAAYDRGEGLGRPVVAAVSPGLCVARKGLRPQIDGARRDSHPEQGMGDRTQPGAGEGAAVHDEAPAPIAELRTGGAALLAGVEHAGVGGGPEARASGPGRRVAKRRGEEVVQSGRRHGRLRFRLVEQLFQDRLLVVAVHQPAGRSDVLGLDRAPGLEAAARGFRFDRARCPGNGGQESGPRGAPAGRVGRGRAPSARFSAPSHARAFSSEATIESSERNRRTKSAPSSHSLRPGSRRYLSANMRDTVGSLTPSVAATRDWLSSRARAARTTALVSTLRRSGAGSGVRRGAWGLLIQWKLYPAFLSRESNGLEQLGLACARQQRG